MSADHLLMRCRKCSRIIGITDGLWEERVQFFNEWFFYPGMCAVCGHQELEECLRISVEIKELEQKAWELIAEIEVKSALGEIQ